MRALNGFVLSVVLGVVGAGLWVGLSRVYDTWLLGACACVVGALVGSGMAQGSRRAGGGGQGFLAALVCLGCCLGAKGGIAWCRATDFMEEHETLTDEDVYDSLCSQTYGGMVEQGTLTGDETEYPDEVYDAAAATWRGMSGEEREDYRAFVVGQWRANEGALTGAASAMAFMMSWTMLDICAITSGCITAWRLGGKRGQDEQEIPEWALGPGRALTATPASAAALAGPMVGGSMLAPAVGGGAKAGKVAGESEGGGTSAGDSFWTRLGSEPPARQTPSLRREPREAGGEEARSRAA